jgi:hypothetical protein
MALDDDPIRQPPGFNPAKLDFAAVPPGRPDPSRLRSLARLTLRLLHEDRAAEAGRGESPPAEPAPR